MPRIQHLANINHNRIYALEAKILYVHSTPKMTTAIIQQQSVQSKIKLHHKNIIQELEGEQIQNQLAEGCSYHFGFCYVSPNGWINVRHPEKTINKMEEQEKPYIKLCSLSEIANNSQNLNGHYLSTILYVIMIEDPLRIDKQGKQLNCSTLKCYSNGYLVDVNFWNLDLPASEIVGKWIVFKGFRLKKRQQWKFVLVSSAYSKIFPYEEQIKGIPYSFCQKYHSLSSVYEERTVSQMNLLLFKSQKIYSTVFMQISNINSYSYEGCQNCRKKICEESKCFCLKQNNTKIFTIMKIILKNKQQEIEASVFDQKVQDYLSQLKEPIQCKINLKSYKKYDNIHEHQIVHIITKIFA